MCSSDLVGHPFRLYTGERLSDMVESIRQNGILMPLIIRRIFDDKEHDYEMLSGHNRMNAGQIAGLEGAWCLIKEGLTDAGLRCLPLLFEPGESAGSVRRNEAVSP